MNRGRGRGSSISARGTMGMTRGRYLPGSSTDRVLNSYNAPVFVSQTAEQAAEQAAAAEAAAAEAAAAEAAAEAQAAAEAEAQAAAEAEAQAAAERPPSTRGNVYYPPRTNDLLYPNMEFSNSATNIPGLPEKDPSRRWWKNLNRGGGKQRKKKSSRRQTRQKKCRLCGKTRRNRK